MSIKIKPLRKFTTGTPTTSDMVEGELAVNTADKKVFMRDNANNIVEVGASSELFTSNATINIDINGTVTADGLDIAKDTDASAEIGKAHIGYVGHDDFAGFSHVDQDSTTSYALLQNSAGITYLNAANGKNIYHRINNVDVFTTNSAGLVLASGKTLNGHQIPGGTGTLALTSDITGGSVAANNITTGNAEVEIVTTSGQITIDNQANNQDIVFKGNDAGSTITALTLDMSAGGNAKFSKNINLESDSAILRFGADKEIEITHVHNTGLLLNSTSQLQFGDSGTYIHQSADGVLDLVSDTEIEINATTVDINATIVDINGMTNTGGLFSNGSIGNSQSAKGVYAGLSTAGDAQISLVGDNTDVSPQIDFSHDVSIDYDVRLILEDAGNRLSMKSHGNETMANFNGDGAVELYHDANKKFETTSTGATVTGALDVNSITPSSGSITIDGILSSNATINKYGSSGAPIVFTVTVATQTAAHPYNGDGSSSKYVIDGVMGAALTLHGADDDTSNSEYIYKFDQSDSTNANHPLRFYLQANKTNAYTTGVTANGTPGQAGAFTLIEVTKSTPKTLFYHVLIMVTWVTMLLLQIQLNLQLMM